MVQLADIIACHAVDEYRVMLGGALNVDVTPVEAKKIMYQAVPCVGMARVLDFLHVTNEVLEQRAVSLPLPPQPTTTRETRHEKGREVQRRILGEKIDRSYAESPKEHLHIQRHLSANCFGDDPPNPCPRSGSSGPHPHVPPYSSDCRGARRLERAGDRPQDGRSRRPRTKGNADQNEAGAHLERDGSRDNQPGLGGRSHRNTGVNTMAGKTTKKVATRKQNANSPKGARKVTPGRVGAKPVLLAGGNPQIAKADGDAPVQAYIAAMPGWKSDVGRRLDALIVRKVPGVRKAVKWNSPFYGVEGQGWFLDFHTFTNYVKVAFFRGASLRPAPPGESKHKEVRYLDIREHDQLDEAQLASWIRQAAALPGWVP